MTALLASKPPPQGADVAAQPPPRRNIGHMATRTHPLLAVGNEAEWAQINEEEARQEAEFAASLSMAERVAYGQKLSQQAVSLLVASVKAGHAPRRALWS
jgi:hypothetical protein